MQGHKKTIKMLKSGHYAHFATIITAKRVIADEFGSHGVCRFYYAPEALVPASTAMIFPVGYAME